MTHQRKCYVVDDEPAAIELLESYIAQSPGYLLAGSQTNPVLALQEIERLQPEIVFLDGDMPRLKGPELAALIRTFSKAAIIVASAHPNYAIAAFDMQAADFLHKPFDYARFLMALQKTEAREPNTGSAQAQLPFIFIPQTQKSRWKQVPLDEIDYVESNSRCTWFYMGRNKSMENISLKELEAFLPPTRFARVHKTCIVALKSIKNIEAGALHLHSGATLTIGREFKEGFFQKLNLAKM